MTSTDIFFSHNSRDKPQVRPIVRKLEQEGLDVWFDEDDLLAGVSWVPELDRAIKATTVFVAAVGESGIGPWQQPELEAALMESVSRKVPVIPVLLPGAPAAPDLPNLLKRFTWVDFRNGFDNPGKERILKAVEVGHEIQGTAQASPQARKQQKYGALAKIAYKKATPIAWGALGAVVLLSLFAHLPLYESWYVNVAACLATSLIIAGAGYLVGHLPVKYRWGRSREALLGIAAGFFTSALFFLVAFFCFTEPRPISYSRGFTGSYSQDFNDVLTANAGNYEATKDDFQFDPRRIYTGASLRRTKILLITLWLTSSATLGLMVSIIRWLRQQTRESDSNNIISLVAINIQKPTLEKLHSIPLNTIGDLIAMSSNQLKSIGNLDQNEIIEIEDKLAFAGLQLRASN